MLSFFWIHSDYRPNPSDQEFWNCIPRDKVTCNKICGGAAKGMIKTAASPLAADETRICLIHISDCLGKKTLEEIEKQHGGEPPLGRVCAYFTKGNERQLSAPPYLFGLEEHVLPNLNGLLELLKREASADEFRALFDRWAHPEKTAMQRLADLLSLDILVQGALALLNESDTENTNDPQRQEALKTLQERPWDWYDVCLPCLGPDIMDAQGKLAPQLAAVISDDGSTPGLAAVARTLRKTGDKDAEGLTNDELALLCSTDILTACHQQYVDGVEKARERC